MTIDLTTASVRPAGNDGLAARTAAGFIVLGSADAAPLLSFVDDNQMQPDLIEHLADKLVAANPQALAMLFTAAAEPYLLAWGDAVASVSSPAARFTVTPVAGQVLVHQLALDGHARVVLSNGTLDSEPVTAPINLAEGSLAADAVVIDVTGTIFDTALTPNVLPSADTAREPSASGPPAAAAIIFADDLDEISDLIDDPTVVVPEPEADFLPEIGLFEPPSDPAPAASHDGSGAHPFDVPNEAPGITFADPDPASPDIAMPIEISIPTNGGETSAFADAAAPPGLFSRAGAAEVPPEFRRDLNPEPGLPAVDPGPTPLPSSPDDHNSVGPVMVLGVMCSQSHHNHPDAVYCSQCGTKMGVHQTTVLVNGPRPPLGILVVDDGTTYSIDKDMILGRDPASHPDVRGGAAAPMVLVDDTLSLSRQHARLVLDDWSVNVTDLGSSNGTWLNRGPNPQQWSAVEAGAQTALEPGDRLRVGGRIVQVELHHIR